MRKIEEFIMNCPSIFSSWGKSMNPLKVLWYSVVNISLVIPICHHIGHVAGTSGTWCIGYSVVSIHRSGQWTIPFIPATSWPGEEDGGWGLEVLQCNWSWRKAWSLPYALCSVLQIIELVPAKNRGSCNIAEKDNSERKISLVPFIFTLAVNISEQVLRQNTENDMKYHGTVVIKTI